MDWHYAQNNETIGPVTEDEIKELIARGTINADTMVWNSTFEDWQALSATGLAALLSTGSDDAAHVGLLYAGFWIRVGSTMLDGIILWPINMLVLLLFGLSATGGTSPETFMGVQLLGQFIQISVSFLYTTLLIWKYGGTLGMLALGLCVVNPDGSMISYPKSLGRYFAYILNGFTFGIGFIMVAFDKEKRALHDVICGTRVVYKKK